MADDKLDKNVLLKALDWTYDKVVGGVAGTSNCYELAQEYLRKYVDPKIAARKLANMQITKCATTGFLTGLGGLITLPVTLPANITAVWFVQLRMIAAIAVLGGLDPKDDQVQTLCYACLSGSGGVDIVKQAGIQFAKQGGKVLIKKIPGEVFKAMNAKLGMRFITKFGEKGIINLGKGVPVLGGLVGGGIDLASTRVIANTAIRLFLSDIIY